jgi:hypothetical protein
MNTRLRVAAAGLLALGLLLGACGDDDGADVRASGASDAGGSGSGSGSASAAGSGACVTEGTTDKAASQRVAVELKEWSVTPTPDSANAGPINFATSNAGAENHELVIVKADSADDLPVVEGAVDEDALPEGAFIGEIEAFGAGGTCVGTFDLPAGNYVLFCNIVETEDGEQESHFLEGMHTEFTVG